MRKTTPVCAETEELSVNQWERLIEGWILDGEIRQLSPRTIEERRNITGKLLWFLRQREFAACGVHELRAFLAYVTNGHRERGGRWGNARNSGSVRPRTVQAYFRVLRALTRWMVEEGAMAVSPVASLRPPIARADQIQPFTPEQVAALLAGAHKSVHPRRNEAILLFLLDTGCRASELCSLTVRDLDLTGRKVRILGKGNKYRTVYLGKHVTKALWSFLRDEPRDGAEPLFTADRGPHAGEPLTRYGLTQLIGRLGRKAGLDTVRCSAHTFRHTFAIEFLRAGGNVFTLKELLGHTTLVMTNRYVALAQADLEAQHRLFSPADRLRSR